MSLFLSLKSSKKLQRDRTFVTFVVQQILKNPNTQTLKTQNPKPKSTTKVTKAEGTIKRLKVKIRTVSLFLSLKSSKKLQRDRTFVTFVVQQILKNPNTQTLKTQNPKPKSTTKVTKAEGTIKRLKVKIRTVSLFLSLKSSKKLQRDRTFVTFVVQQILKNPKTQKPKNSKTQKLKHSKLITHINQEQTLCRCRSSRRISVFIFDDCSQI